MVLVGAGQGATLSPLTAAGIAGVSAEDAGAASGLINVAHQLGCTNGMSGWGSRRAACPSLGIFAPRPS